MGGGWIGSVGRRGWVEVKLGVEGGKGRDERRGRGAGVKSVR